MRNEFHKIMMKIVSFIIALSFILVSVNPLFAAAPSSKPSANVYSVQNMAASAGASEFVTRLYQFCLGRDPDPAGLDQWTNILLSGQGTGSKIAFGFVFSSEFQNRAINDYDYVTIMYKAILNRTPDIGGFNQWLSALYNGMSRYSVLVGFTNSIEFSNLCQSYGIVYGNLVLTQPADLYPFATAFVTRLYRLCLNRTPDPTGLNDWVNMLQTGQNSAARVAYNIIFSSEFINRNVSNFDYIAIMYNAFLNRGPDDGGFTNWLNILDAGGSRYDVFMGFVDSIEFTNFSQTYAANYGYANVIAVIAIAISGADTVYNAQTLQLGAIITPFDALNKTIAWTVTTLSGGTATIDATGLLTATGVGTVTVTATATDAFGATGTKVISITASFQAIAEAAVAAYEAAPLATLAEVAVAEGLKPAADAAVAAVADTTARAAFALRISNRAAVIAAAKATLQAGEALAAINMASTATMRSVILTYSTLLGLTPATLADYNLLTQPNLDIVHAALAGKAFVNVAAVNYAYNLAVSVQIINVITISATMEAAIKKYAGILVLDATAYSTYVAASVNAASFKAHINTVLMAAVMPTTADVQAAFAAAVMAEAVHTIDIQLFNFMERDLRTYSVILGLNLTDFDTLINKSPVITAMVAEPFIAAAPAHVKEFFDVLVAQQKALEALPMLEAFNTAPDAATMGNVLAIYQTLFKAADYNAYNNFIGTSAKTAINTAMLAPTFLTEKEIQMAFIIGLMNNALINSGKVVFNNNYILLGLSTSLSSNEFAALPLTERNLITNAIFAAKPIADHEHMLLTVFNTTTTTNYIGTLLSLNGSVLGLNLALFNTIIDKTPVYQALMGKAFTSVAELKAVFDAEVAILTTVDATLVSPKEFNVITPALVTTFVTLNSATTITGIDNSGAALVEGSDYTFDASTGVLIINQGYIEAYIVSSGINPGDVIVLSVTFDVGSSGGLNINVINNDIAAVGSASMLVNTSIITFTLTTGTFDAVAAIIPSNWVLNGIPSTADLGTISSVVLSSGDTTATITVTGIALPDTLDYNIEPTQAAFAAGFISTSYLYITVI